MIQGEPLKNKHSKKYIKQKRILVDGRKRFENDTCEVGANFLKKKKKTGKIKFRFHMKADTCGVGRGLKRTETYSCVYFLVSLNCRNHY